MSKDKNRFLEPIGGRVIGTVETSKKDRKKSNENIKKFLRGRKKSD